MAAFRVHRRHGGGLPRLRPPGDRRQRQLLQRERGGGHRSHAGARRARTGRRGARRVHPDSNGRRAMRSSCSARTRGRSYSRARAGRPSAGATAAARCRSSTSPRIRRCARWWPSWWRRRWPGRPVRSVPCTTCRREVSPSSWPRWRPKRASAVWSRRPTRPSCSPSFRPASSSPRTTPRRCATGPASAGVPAAVIGRVGGARFTLGDLIDLPLTELVGAYEGSLAQALGDR